MFVQLITTMFRQGFHCLFWLVTGLYCPGCGGTRAIRALLRGDIFLSIQYHPIVCYTLLVTILELVSWQVAKKTKNPRHYLGHVLGFVYLGVAIILINWAVKNIALVAFGVDLLPPWH